MMVLTSTMAIAEQNTAITTGGTPLELNATSAGSGPAFIFTPSPSTLLDINTAQTSDFSSE